MCYAVCVCMYVCGSDYDKHSLLARYGGDILRPRDVHKVWEFLRDLWESLFTNNGR